MRAARALHARPQRLTRATLVTVAADMLSGRDATASWSGRKTCATWADGEPGRSTMTQS